jgi:hypothetical protein
MVSADYQKIRDENIARYGWDTAVLDLLGHLYSERTHFIFELIQNAEDAGATELSFELFDDRLEVSHDGRPFTEDDVRGICGVGSSAKSGDLTKIGKFGIGFKSVYAYTRTPRIHSPGEHFRIENYVRPFPVDPPGGLAAGTLFIFPFDLDSVPAATATAEISAALAVLEASTLLFLRSIRRVSSRGAGLTGSALERAAASRSSWSRDVTLSNGRRQTQQWLVWDRMLDDLGHPGQRVEIAFQVRTAAGQPQIVRRADCPMVVFFPTEKQTHLGFLIQGPYRTTPARDNIPERDRSNQALARETAALLTEVLRDIRDQALLTADVLQALPLDAARFPAGAMLRPLYESARTALRAEELIPAGGDGCASAAALRLPAGAGLRELLAADQLGALYGAAQPIAFADESVSENGTPELWRYLRDEIGIGEVTPEDVIGRISSEFLQAQPDAWIARFYAFVHQDYALWQAPSPPDERSGPARAKPIIRLEDGRHIVPFRAGDRPAAYLPGPAPTGLPTVRRALAEIPAARRFLEALGFTEPDVAAEVLDRILPRYRQLDIADLDPAQHAADLECVVRALAEAAPGRREQLMERLQETAFLAGENAATGELRLMTPASLYQRTKDLEIYFDGNPGIWFAGDRYGPWLVQLRGMGVRDSVRIHARHANPHGYVLIAEEFARHERGIGGFDPDAEIDGLDFALRHPGHARSEYAWNALLAPNQQLVAGVVEKSVRQEFLDSRQESIRSAIGLVATGEEWLPGPDGRFRRAAELSLEDLPAVYQRDEALAKALGMIQPAVAEASRQLGLPAELLWGLSRYPDLAEAVGRELSVRAAAEAAGRAGS